MPRRIEPPMDRDPRTHQGRWQEQVCDLLNKEIPADSTATTVDDLRTDFNALLAILRKK